VNSGPAGAETLSRDDRLRKRREFEECYASGVRASGRYIQLFLSADEALRATRCRLGISVSRRVGHAVTRNLVRRRLREIFRRERAALPPSATALVIHARPSAADASFEALRSDYLDTIARAARMRMDGRAPAAKTQKRASPPRPRR
jgi:ribonuclease P protein component